MKKSLLYLVMLAMGITSLTACSDDDDDKTPATTNPAVTTEVLSSFKAKYPDVNVDKEVKWETKGQYTVADFDQVNGLQEVEAWFDTKSGEWKMSETDYGEDWFLLPATLNANFYKTPYSTYEPGDIYYYEYPDATRNTYVVEASKTGQQEMDLYFNSSCEYLKAVVHTGADITPDTQL